MNLSLFIYSKRLTAEECLNHEWLKRKQTIPQRTPSMDVTKDNLKQFVERWNEHPNSPYIFEINSTEQFEVQRSNSSHSLVCESPSPCESLASLSNSETEGDNLLGLPSVDSMRRASDSNCFVKTQDITERISLAEEIRKLSDKLFELSNNIPTSITSNTQTNFDDLKLPERKKETIIPIEHDEFPSKDHPASPQCTIPWRRPKFKLNGMSRDVPLAVRTIYKTPDKPFNANSPNGTKDLLLQLLEHWDGPKIPQRTNTRHASVSSEWTENDSLGQRTISSLNTFFQSRATNKKITAFHLHQN